MVVLFTSDGIHLRKIEKEDLPSLSVLKGESWMSTHQKSILNKENQEAWFGNLDNNPHSPSSLILIAETVSPHMAISNNIGCFKISDIDYINRSANVGWDIFEKHRGKGLGKRLVVAGSTFCFDILNLRRLDAEILSTNKPSQKCAISAGFEQEGVRREAIHKPDGYVDSQIWGLLKGKRDA